MADLDLDQTFSKYGTIEYLEIDDAFNAHMITRGTYAKHIVSIAEILEVLEGSPKFYANGEGRRAPVIIVGPTRAGRMLVVPVEPSGKWEVWKPVTAFTANTHDVERYNEE